MLDAELILSNFVFEAANSSDLSELNVLVNRGYRGDESKKGWTTEADLLGGQRTDVDSLLEMMSEPQAFFLLARENGKLVGSVYLQVQNKKCYLGMLTVDPLLQGRGLGKTMLHHAEFFAKTMDCECIHMTVISVRSELLAWYERHGYRRTGRTEPFPENDPKFGIPKVSNLQFEVLEKPL